MSSNGDHNVPLVAQIKSNTRYTTFTNKDLEVPVTGWMSTDDGPPVSRIPTEVRDYLLAVSKGLRHAYKFAFDSRGVYGRTRYFVYDPNDLYVLGFIGYGDFSISRNGDPKYVVFAQNIENNKCDSYRVQHRMKMSENVHTAVRNAKRHLLPISHQEVIRRSYRDTLDKVKDFGETFSDDLTKALSKINLTCNVSRVRQAPIWLELCHKMDSGQHFLSAEFHKDVANARSIMATMDEQKALPVTAYCVRVYERLGEQTFDVARIPDISVMSGWDTDSLYDSLHGTPRYRAETLPSDIMSKLAALSICDVGDYVEEVGHRNMETLYYVYA